MKRACPRGFTVVDRCRLNPNGGHQFTSAVEVTRRARKAHRGDVMRGTTPTLHCDAEDGMCGTWEVDYYEATASAVNGVRITEERRAPGWVSTRFNDYCPEHTDAEEATA